MSRPESTGDIALRWIFALLLAAAALFIILAIGAASNGGV